MKNVFLDIKVGDIVIVYDEYSHDYIQHILKVDSIEYDKDWITETNPKGMHCFGTDLQQEEFDDDYITQIHEGNFVKIVQKRKNLWVCNHCLEAIQSKEGQQMTKIHYIDPDCLEDSLCDWCESVGYNTLYEFI